MLLDVVLQRTIEDFSQNFFYEYNFETQRKRDSKGLGKLSGFAITQVCV